MQNTFLILCSRKYKTKINFIVAWLGNIGDLIELRVLIHFTNLNFRNITVEFKSK